MVLLIYKQGNSNLTYIIWEVTNMEYGKYTLSDARYELKELVLKLNTLLQSTEIDDELQGRLIEEIHATQQDILYFKMKEDN
jgi:hypothetical protein